MRSARFSLYLAGGAATEEELMEGIVFGPPYLLVSTGRVEIDPDVEEDPDVKAHHAAETVWARHNVDDRPFGRAIRSMSMGDVVVLSVGIYAYVLRAVSVGFEDFTAEWEKLQEQVYEPGAVNETA